MAAALGRLAETPDWIAGHEARRSPADPGRFKVVAIHCTEAGEGAVEALASQKPGSGEAARLMNEDDWREAGIFWWSGGSMRSADRRRLETLITWGVVCPQIGLLKVKMNHVTGPPVYVTPNIAIGVLHPVHALGAWHVMAWEHLVTGEPMGWRGARSAKAFRDASARVSMLIRTESRFRRKTQDCRHLWGGS